MNKSAVQRGLFISDYYRTYKDEEKKRQSSNVKMQEKFEKPNIKKTLGTRGNNYDKLENNGLPKVNTFMKEKDVIIGKIHPIHSKKDNKERDIFRHLPASVNCQEMRSSIKVP